MYTKSFARNSGVNAIESLMERRGTFDYILLETTGLADPGNIAPLFWVDDGLGSTIYLDGIVTVVDAKNVLLCLDEPLPPPTEEDHQTPLVTVAHLQISHADIIVLNKSDMVSAEELQNVKARIQAINSLAAIRETQYGQIPNLQGVVLDLHAYDHVGTLETAEKGHSHPDAVCVFIFFFPLSKCFVQNNTPRYLRPLLIVKDNLYGHNPRSSPQRYSTCRP